MEQIDRTVQTLPDVRIAVLNKTLDRSFMRLYSDFQPDTDYHAVPLAA